MNFPAAVGSICAIRPGIRFTQFSDASPGTRLCLTWDAELAAQLLSCPIISALHTGPGYSDVAVNEARSRARDRPEAVFVRSDMLTYGPTRLFDVILLRDSIYYNSVTRGPSYLGALYTLPGAGQGLRGADVPRCPHTSSNLRCHREAVRVIEQLEYEEPFTLILVFRSG